MEGTVMAGKSRWLGFPETDDLGAILGQFEGMTIGVPGNGSIHDVILKETINRYASNRNILVKNYPWADLVTEAVATEEVAAAFGTPALAIAIKHFAGGRILYPAAKLWPDNPSYGIIADRPFLSAHRETIEKFLIAHEEAEDGPQERPCSCCAIDRGPRRHHRQRVRARNPPCLTEILRTAHDKVHLLHHGIRRRS